MFFVAVWVRYFFLFHTNTHSLEIPFRLAIKTNSYLGTGLQSLHKFLQKGEFLEGLTGRKELQTAAVEFNMAERAGNETGDGLVTLFLII